MQPLSVIVYSQGYFLIRRLVAFTTGYNYFVWACRWHHTGLVFICLQEILLETSNSGTQYQWSGLSVLQLLRHFLCRLSDNPRDKGVSCQSDNHQTSHSFPPHWLQSKGTNMVTGPNPVFTFSLGLLWLSASWFLSLVNKGQDWCEQTGHRSSYSIRGVNTMVTFVFLTLWQCIDTNM